MKKRQRYSLLNKLIRINFIKTEIYQLVKKILLKNQYYSAILKTKNLNDDNFYYLIKKSRSKHKLFCSITNNPRVVNKKYKFSRFVLNKLGNQGKISTFYKKGW